MMMSRVRGLMAAALVVAGAAACSDVTGNNVNAEGSFFLDHVTDNTGTFQVPYQFTDANGNVITVMGDTYSLNSDGTYDELQQLRVNGSTQAKSEFGDWSQSGNTVFFTPITSDISLNPYQGSVRNNGTFGGTRTLTISINGTTAVYTD